MIRNLLSLTLIFIQFACQAQKGAFTIKHIEFKDYENKNRLTTENSGYFYEDEIYTVEKNCMGEFGGQVTFTDKKTGKEYSYNSTCAIIINKLNDNYYITSTLAHLSGFAAVEVVKNPSLLDSVTNTETLVDSIGILTLGSFIYDKKLFHIITDRDKTYLAQISNGRYEILETLLDESLYMYGPTITKNVNGEYLIKIQYLTNKSPMARKKIEGYILVSDNKIQIIKK